MVTVTTLSHNDQNPVMANDHHTMEAAVTAHTFTNIIQILYHKAQNLSTANTH
jgi:hypothetical protein